MYTFYIDTTERYEKKVQLKNGKKVISEKSGDLDVVVCMRDLLNENSLDISDVEIVNVNKGPGSFTGLKIGVAVANTLNWFLGKKNINELVMPKYGSAPNIHKTKWLEK